MPPAEAPAHQRTLQATIVSATDGSATLQLAGAEAPPSTLDASHLATFLASLPDDTVLSPSVACCAAVDRLARALIHRGSVRPAPSRDGTSLRWVAWLDATERTTLAAIQASSPTILFGGTTASADHETRWNLLRALLDTLCAHRLQPMLERSVRAITPPPAPGAIEPEWERLLLGHPAGSGATRRRVLAMLPAWDEEVSRRTQPRCRLVVRLEERTEGDAENPFVLRFFVEAPGVGRIATGALWEGLPSARALADDLTPVRNWLLALLRQLGTQLLPVELSLATGRPELARLSGADAWRLASVLMPELQTLGITLETTDALSELPARFPRARLALTRDDGADDHEPTLGGRYSARWEVCSAGIALSPSQLREAGPHAPLARVLAPDGTTRWLPITAESAERLARVAERPVAHWTGPQALAAALAGEVRQPGDLADAEVLAPEGLRALIAELGRDAPPPPVPAGLTATLRHYQERGLGWLFHRTRLGLGALLADDMGLGKTVQLIALLLTLREAQASGGPTLLVCPASLVGNWERELSRFAPELRLVRHHGADRRREADALREVAGPHDVVLTTYGLARRDAALLAQLDWGTLACDEAQLLKNPQSAQARAVRALPARRRVALSGTPVENRLTELWSLMELLNPGLLGPLERFRRELALPIERDRDARAVRWLQAATRPFLLRRLKTDPAVAPELPDKQVIRTWCALSEEQAALYKEAVDESLSAIDAVTGLARQGRVLRLLTRLKQVCNHPETAGDDVETLPLLEPAPPPTTHGRSGKLERLAEMLEEVLAGGERALVFTQYVTMGRRLVAELSRRLGTEVALFHGGLTLPAREALVRRFQEEPNGPPVLVLSLKAGGVGLNLTRATHVFHYDRWWNPAVEDQATDRAHRIGQQHKVTVHHLVTMGTLEERIDRLLEEKRLLADAVVSGGEAWLGALSTDELRALVALGSDAAVESVESWED